MIKTTLNHEQAKKTASGLCGDSFFIIVTYAEMRNFNMVDKHLQILKDLGSYEATEVEGFKLKQKTSGCISMNLIYKPIEERL